MHALLVTTGSLGSTLPFVFLGQKLKSRGHRVTLIASGHFRGTVERAGIEFVPSSSDEEYARFVSDQHGWKGRQAIRGLAGLFVEQLSRVYDLVSENIVPGETVLAALGYASGARIAQEKHEIPLATVHLQPMWMRSTHEVPGLPRWCPRAVPVAMDRLIDVGADLTIGRHINQFRRRLGLPSVHQVFKRWWNSPRQVIGFFPDWFAPPQPDWPPNVLLPGFPLDLHANDSFDLSAVEEFLAAGDPPLVFSQSSVTLDAAYFAESLELARRLGRRAIILASHREQIPASMSHEARCFDFVPLELLLPRALLHVHHGGVGTIAHSLAAGVPQVTVPMVNDQRDNSLRLARLGVSRLVRRKDYQAQNLVESVTELLGSAEVAERCKSFAQRCRQADPLTTAAIALEQLHAGSDA